MTPAPLYAVFSIRGKDDERLDDHVAVQITSTWQEGPDDLHIRFPHNQEQWFFPDMKKGDYVIPGIFPGDKKLRAYCMCFTTEPFDPGRTIMMPREYAERITDQWQTPN